MKLTELPYQRNSAQVFSAIAEEPWAVWLDSCSDTGSVGRYDIMAARPVSSLVSRDLVTTVTTGDDIKELQGDPLELLEDELDTLDYMPCDLPFSGGALGYFSYDLGKRFEDLPDTTSNDENLPLMAVGIYRWAVIVDHQLEMTTLVLQGDSSEVEILEKEVLGLLDVPYKERGFSALGEVVHEIDKPTYASGFERIKEYIDAGDCYQINYAQRFSVPCQGSVFAAYERLRKLNSAPYAAFMHFPFVSILSSSPELFIHCEDDRVTSKPIKGTVPRVPDDSANQANIDRLEASEKDQAENVMIVDLLRNDFSKACELHTVKVPKLFEVESYARVHHLVSTVTGQLQEDKSSLDLIRGAFPGGSITGAPKIRAMEIIDELEDYRRGVYCGSIGYINWNGDAQLNIAIRTMTWQQGDMRFWSGGGIVHDSTMEGEYQETLDKAAAIVAALSEDEQE